PLRPPSSRVLIDPATPQIYPLSLHDALPISSTSGRTPATATDPRSGTRSITTSSRSPRAPTVNPTRTTGASRPARTRVATPAPRLGTARRRIERGSPRSAPIGRHVAPHDGVEHRVVTPPEHGQTRAEHALADRADLLGDALAAAIADRGEDLDPLYVRVREAPRDPAPRGLRSDPLTG